MRNVIAAIFIAALPFAALAQNEVVTVTANDVTGPWKFGWPLWLTTEGMQIKFGRVNAVDAAEKAAIVAKVLADVTGGSSVPPLHSVSTDWLPHMAESLQALGGVEGVAYLGRLPSLAESLKERPEFKINPLLPPPNDNPVEIFAVDFAKGERLCGLRLRPDGAVNGFDCI